MLRKPYVVADHMYSSGVRKSDVARVNRDGYLTHSPWVRPEEHDRSDPAARLERGRLVLLGQCASCHPPTEYRSMKTLLSDRKGIDNLLDTLHKHADDSPYRKFVPLLAATADERVALRDYLSTLALRATDTSGHARAVSAGR